MSSSPPLQHCQMNWMVCVDAFGADADDFLRGQLTQNPPPSDGDAFSFAAWNDARGRVRALFRLVRLPDRCVLLAERENIESVLSKLRMFVLRAKVDLVPNDALRVVAVLGNAEEWLSGRAVRLSSARGAAVRSGGLSWLRIGPELIHVVGAAAEVEDVVGDLLPAVPERGEIAEIALGIPRIGAALEQRYVPQMLNLDRLDGISFTKGCYPGQEVVARLHNLGSVKRRARRFSFAVQATAPEPGGEIVAADRTVVGEVVRAASAEGRTQLLAVVQLDALDAPLFLGPEAETALTLEPLPF